jgi:hypothetical protein
VDLRVLVFTVLVSTLTMPGVWHLARAPSDAGRPQRVA